MPEGIEWQQLAAPAVFIVAMLVMFWWVVIRPTQTRQKKHKDLVDSLMPGDDIITVGGVHGRVTRAGDNSLDVEIAKGVTITLDRRAVRRLREQEDF